MSVLSSALTGKRIELLKGLRPTSAVIGYLLNLFHPMAVTYSERSSGSSECAGHSAPGP